MNKLLVVLCFYLTSCVTLRGFEGPPANSSEQAKATVKIEKRCLSMNGGLYGSRGSGVAVSPTHILTAYHVTECDGIVVLTATTSGGEELDVMVDKGFPESDIARLIIIDKHKLSHYVTTVAPRPRVDSVICSESAVPGWNRKCGWVEKLTDREDGDVRHSAVVEPGNSGSGVYDEDGNLVGIMTMLYWCPNLPDRQVCGGLFSSIWKHRELMYP